MFAIVTPILSIILVGYLFGKRRGKNGKKPGPPVHDDLVQRDFTAGTLDELWLTDITEHPTDEGKLYLCAVKLLALPAEAPGPSMPPFGFHWEPASSSAR